MSALDKPALVWEIDHARSVLSRLNRYLLEAGELEVCSALTDFDDELNCLANRYMDDTERGAVTLPGPMVPVPVPTAPNEGTSVSHSTGTLAPGSLRRLELWERRPPTQAVVQEICTW